MRETFSLVRMLALGLGTLVIQFGIINNFLPLGCPSPQLMVLPIILISLRLFSPLGVLGVWLLGLTTDMAGATGLGPWSAAFVVLYGLITVTLFRRVRESAFTLGGLAFIATYVARIVHEFFRWPSTGILFFDHFSLYALYEALLTAAVLTLLLSINLSKLILRLRSLRGRRSGVVFSSQVEGG